jgi:glycosyltransferase involved in cell wall biosynthesis
MHNKRRLFFTYVIPANFSGQASASLQIINHLISKGVEINVIPLYPLRRSIDNLFRRWLDFISKQALIIPEILKLLFTRGSTLHINLGQSYYSFLRIGLWFFPIRFLNNKISTIISLHGNTFTNWEKGQKLTRVFMKFMEKADVITVLGNMQKNKLINLGVFKEKIHVVFNTCDLEAVDSEFIKTKHQDDNVINVLFLSLLIESKGFPEFLESAMILAGKTNRKINFILCGPIAFTEYCTRFKSSMEKEKWITERINDINKKNSNVTIQWIPGAKGNEKADLFKMAHIFVLPTYFPVEAQPLVLIEAMSTGATIITSKVGEIQTILEHDYSSVLLDIISPESIAKEIENLIDNREKRILLANNALNFYNENLTKKIYFSRWNELLWISDYEMN